MKTITLSEARANISQFLAEVENGETLVIQPDTPEQKAARDERGREAIKRILELRKLNQPATVEEILAWRDEGRR